MKYEDYTMIMFVLYKLIMIYKQIHVGKTMENKPPMTGNGEHTTNLW